MCYRISVRNTIFLFFLLYMAVQVCIADSTTRKEEGFRFESAAGSGNENEASLLKILKYILLGDAHNSGIVQSETLPELESLLPVSLDFMFPNNEGLVSRFRTSCAAGITNGRSTTRQSLERVVSRGNRTCPEGCLERLERSFSRLSDEPDICSQMRSLLLGSYNEALDIARLATILLIRESLSQAPISRQLMGFLDDSRALKEFSYSGMTQVHTLHYPGSSVPANHVSSVIDDLSLRIAALSFRMHASLHRPVAERGDYENLLFDDDFYHEMSWDLGHLRYLQYGYVSVTSHIDERGDYVRHRTIYLPQDVRSPRVREFFAEWLRERVLCERGEEVQRGGFFLLFGSALLYLNSFWY